MVIRSRNINPEVGFCATLAHCPLWIGIVSNDTTFSPMDTSWSAAPHEGIKVAPLPSGCVLSSDPSVVLERASDAGVIS